MFSFFLLSLIVMFVSLQFLVTPALSQPLRSYFGMGEIVNGISSESDNNMRTGCLQFREGNYIASNPLSDNRISKEVAANIDSVNMYPMMFNSSGSGSAYAGVKLPDYPGYGVVVGSASPNENQAAPIATGYEGNIQSHPNVANAPSWYQLYSNVKNAYAKPQPLPVNPYDLDANPGAMAQDGYNPGYKQVPSNPAVNYGQDRIYQLPVSSAGIMVPQNVYQSLSNASAKTMSNEHLLRPMSAESALDIANDFSSIDERNLQKNQVEVSAGNVIRMERAPLLPKNDRFRVMSSEQGSLKLMRAESAPNVINDVPSMQEQNLENDHVGVSAEKVNRPERALLDLKNVNTMDDTPVKGPLKNGANSDSREMEQRPKREMVDIKRKTFIVDKDSLARRKRGPQDVKGRFLDDILGPVDKDSDVHKVETISLGDRILKRDADVTLLQKKIAESSTPDRKPTNQLREKRKTGLENQQLDQDLAEDKPVADSGLGAREPISRRDTHLDSSPEIQKDDSDPAQEGLNADNNIAIDRQDTKLEAGSKSFRVEPDSVDGKQGTDDNIVDPKPMDRQDIQPGTGRESQKVDLDSVGGGLGIDGSFVNPNLMDRRDMQLETGCENQKFALDSVDDEMGINENNVESESIDRRDSQPETGRASLTDDLDLMGDKLGPDDNVDRKRDIQPVTGSEGVRQNDEARMVSVEISNRLRKASVSPRHSAPVPENQEAALSPTKDEDSKEADWAPIGAPNRLRRGSSPCLCTSKISVNAVVPCSNPCKMTTSKSTQGRQRAICTTRCVLNVLIPCKSNLRNSPSAQAEMPEMKVSGLDESSQHVGNSSGESEEAGMENKEKG